MQEDKYSLEFSIKYTLPYLLYFFLLAYGYFSDLLLFKRFPLTPSFSFKRNDKAIHSSSGCPMREAKNA